MKKIFRNVQFLANLATIVIAVLLSFIVIKQYILPNSDTRNSNINLESGKSSATPALAPNSKEKVNPVGKTVPLEKVNWKENKRTLVLYLSDTCRFCTESGPFYQKLVEKNSDDKIKLVTVLPQSVDEGKQYLEKLGVGIKDVHSSSLASIGVRSTPTLLLVNEDGIISEMWIGKLSNDKEEELLKRLFG